MNLIERLMACPECDGSGADPKFNRVASPVEALAEPYRHPCPRCKGTGRRSMTADDVVREMRALVAAAGRAVWTVLGGQRMTARRS